MNFLAHYYILPNKQNTQLVFGNLLPDMYRGFSKIYNQELKQHQGFLLSDIGKGVQYHLKTDAFFHKHILFKDSCKTIETCMQKHHLTHHLYPFTAHILFELLIDQHLIVNHKHLVDDFYNHFSTENQHLIKQNLADFLKIIEIEKIFINFKSFIGNKYALYLVKDEGIVQSLQAIIGNRIGVKFDDKLWLPCIEECKAQCVFNIDAIINITRQELRKK